MWGAGTIPPHSHTADRSRSRCRAMCLEMASEFEFGHRRAVLWRLGELRAKSRMRHHHHILLMFESLRDENRLHPGNRTERKEAGLLGATWRNQKPTGVKLGRPWP